MAVPAAPSIVVIIASADHWAGSIAFNIWPADRTALQPALIESL